MRGRGRIVVKPIGIVSNCGVSGGFMFNAQRYMHVNDAYFTCSTIRFPYELKKIFDRTLHELQYLHKEHPHFTLDWICWIGYSSVERAIATHFPLPMFDTLWNLVQDTVYQIMSTRAINTQHRPSIILSLQKDDGSCCSALACGMLTKELIQNPMVLNSRLFVRPIGSKTSKIGRIYSSYQLLPC